MAQKQIQALPAASSVADSDIGPIQQGGTTRHATYTQVREPLRRKDEEVTASIKIDTPTNGTVEIIDFNRQFGTVVGADAKMKVGSCTVTWQIANDDGTGATNITSMASLSVTTTRRSDTASAANTLLKTGSVDRQLLLVLASVSGAGPLLIGLRLKGT